MNIKEINDLKTAVEKGDAKAQYTLGLAYYNGDGVPRNHVETARLWLLAAKQGLTFAQCNLSTLYASGDGVPQDYQESLKWLRMAADPKQGNNAGAQFNLGCAYRDGEGVAQDDTEAVKWWRMAAEQGDAEAQHALAKACFGGKGVPQPVTKSTLLEGVEWLRKSAAQGHAGAKMTLEMLKQQGLI